MSHLLTKHTASRVLVIAKAAIRIWFGILPLPIQDCSCLTLNLPTTTIVT